MPSYQRSRLPGLLLNLTALATAFVPLARAQTTAHTDEIIRLEDVVVSASRTPQDQRYTPSAVTLIRPEDLAAEQIPDLRTALAAQPGVIVVNTGASGGQSTVLLRGANSYQTLFVVDGVRMNDRSAAYQNFFGQADLGGIDRIEVLRGPQGTLYGSSAMGGVIALDTTHGCGQETGTVSALAGSFNTVGGSASVQGGTKELGYSGFIGRLVTDNDRPGNNNKTLNYASRVEFTPNADSVVGVTFRGQDGDYQEPGSMLFVSPGVVESKNYLGTIYGQLRFGPDITSRLTAGWHQRDYAFTSAFGTSYLRNTRDIVDWQNTWVANQKTEVVVGANFERSHYTINGALTKDNVKAGFASITYRPIENITVTGGLRYDDFDSVGSATTGRAGLAWTPAKETKVRATYGTGFSAPGSDDRFGSPFQLPNPNLKPEKSRGWDAGFDQSFYGGVLTTSATYFHNRFTDLFEYDFLSSMTVNRTRATTEGVEVALAGKINDLVSARVAYTYLDAWNDATGVRLTRRPRHVVDGEVRYQISDPWSVGVGVHGVADRLDGATPIEDYVTARLFSSYTLRKDLILKLRVENLFGEEYSEARGYPALPRGVFGAVEWKF